MHESPHAFPVVQTLQQLPVESLQAAVTTGPPVAASVRATAPNNRANLRNRRIPDILAILSDSSSRADPFHQLDGSSYES